MKKAHSKRQTNRRGQNTTSQSYKKCSHTNQKNQTYTRTQTSKRVCLVAHKHTFTHIHTEYDNKVGQKDQSLQN